MKKTFAVMMTALAMTACTQRENPLLMEWEGPMGAPDFSKIQSTDYLPAFEEGIKQYRDDIDAIADNKEKPTFENTIDALEKSGRLLTKVEGIFFNLKETDVDDVMKETEEKIMPMLSEQSAYLTMNEKLFSRVKVLRENQSELGLTREQEMVLDKYWRLFVNGGALLNEDQKAKFLEYDKELGLATMQFGNNSLDETNAFTLLIDDEEQLSGLPENVRTAAKECAKGAGKEGWMFTLQKPSWEPFLKYADNRELRKQMYEAYVNRGAKGHEHDNTALIQKILDLRLKKVQLLGYKTFADYQLEDKMAKTPQAAYDMLMKIWEPALAKAKQERDDMQKLMNESGVEGKLEAWDWFYYAEKLRQVRYAFDENEIKPYLSLDNVRNGVFMVADKLYGLKFKPLRLAGAVTKEDEVQEKLPDVYHSEVSCFEALDENGEHLGLYYTDYFPRKTKGVGAWMTNFVEASHLEGMDADPVIVNVCNFTTPTGDTPSLLNIDETRTLFHEFGHATHGMLTKCHYPAVSGTNVARDFVELPSQIMEHWAVEPEVMKQYAFHYKTGEVIPDSLIAKMQAASTFNLGFETTELVGAALLDLAFHMQESYDGFDAVQFEKEFAEKIGLIPEISFRYRGPYFNHVFSGGYSAGYYSYLWAEVLDADGYNAFKESGNVLNEELGRSFRKNVLEMGGSDTPMELYKRFRGAEPNPDALLHNRGLK